jgi:hypothetical protein
MKKVVRIECKAAITLPLELLEDFQGELKDLTDDAYEKLKSEIITEGYSFAIHIWQDHGHNYILDGHQRGRTLRHMCEYEGWGCPELPVVLVMAKSYKAAKAKLLAATSQYGDMTKQGLYEYIEEAELKFPEVEKRFKFSDINFSKFNEEFYVEPPEPNAPEPTKETKEVTFNAYECPKCGHKFYEGDKEKSAISTKIRRKGDKKGSERRIKGGLAPRQRRS